MTNNEIWKDITGFPGYQVSNRGQIRGFRDFHGNITNNFRILNPRINKDGYYELTIYTSDHKKVTKRIHRLVANAFLGEHSDLVVNHIDGIKTNNVVENLEFVTAERNSTLASQMGLYKTRAVRIVETGEEFDSIKSCAAAINGHPSDINHAISGKIKSVNGLTFEYIDNIEKKNNTKPFLYDFQMDAVDNMFNGCILNGGTGTGKSRTSLFYYFKKQGGWIDINGYTPMKNPKDLYIITTAKKRNSLEWEGELVPYLMSTNEDQNKLYGNKIVIDSWNNIKKYIDITGAFFIFDEDKVQGNGAWVKAFLKIVKSNEWVILSATPGDSYSDYIPVFLAHGFYRNKTEFAREHIVYSRFTKYPKIERYINTGRLNALRNKLLIDMKIDRQTICHHEAVYVKYDITKVRDVTRTRWNIFKDEPIQQASELCYVLRRIVNEDESRQAALLEIYEKHPRIIIFYSFDYELDILLNLYYGEDVTIAQYNGHVHDQLPTGDRWVYLVNYNACEGWNAITTDTMVFYSQTYSYKTLVQAEGRINRLNTPYTDLYYYHLKSRSGIDLAISKALTEKKNFNEGKWAKW